NFTRQEFQEVMFSQSEPFQQPLDFYGALAQSGKYLMAALNNESLDLNLYRVEKFGLRKVFSVFFSSCFLGIKKPNDAMYALALQLTQLQPQECLFIDDRPLNLERARRFGMRTIHCQDPARLPAQMREVGVAP
ncbi:MAG: HAD-IA family hydrolase, partial [Terriglobia bacterium]